MNRLVIIGNGFDLAHQMKTSYDHFMEHYLLNAVAKCAENGFFHDVNMDCILNPNKIATIDSVLAFNSNCTTITANDFRQYKSGGISFPIQGNRVLLHQKNHFLSLLLKSPGKNWMDIEYFYFRWLKTCMQNHTSQPEAIVKLQTDFKNLKILLHKYLTTLTIPPGIDGVHRLVSDVFSGQTRTKFPYLNYEKTLYLNFNYTDTLKTYVNNKGSNQILNIHGTLADNNLIFGYGDENGAGYHEIENINKNIYLENVKSFGYLQDSSHNDLIGFMSSGDFETYIWGHSCGIPDRTLLKRIFEDVHNKSIRIFYYKDETGWDDYTQVAQNISRHFESKDLFRSKVYIKPDCDPFPQTKR